MSRRFPIPRWLQALALCGLIPAQGLHALEPVRRRPSAPPPILATELQVAPSLVLYPMDSPGDLPAPMSGFLQAHPGGWEVRWDVRSDRPHLIQGVGVPIIPGGGNRRPGLAELELLLRRFMGEFPELFRVAPEDLTLDPRGSAFYGRDRARWFVAFRQTHGSVPVENARVYFRINHGNIVQFGADEIADVRIDPVPRLARSAALEAALGTLGIREQVQEILQRGTLEILPAMGPDERVGEPYTGRAGEGYQHRLVWEYRFRLKGDVATYKLVVDASKGDVLELVDLNDYSTVSGGVYPNTNTDAEVVVPFPRATVSTSAGTQITDAAGVYNYTGGTATSALNGQYFRIKDACGPITLSNSTNGDLAFGSSGGTDCTTPGIGGAGNTHAARNAFYHLTGVRDEAASRLAGNASASAWLNGKVTVKTDINSTCNAYWNGTTLNFFRSGGGCSNAGEIASVLVHEWSHGLDQNAGSPTSPDRASGEALGDTLAFLETGDACIGENFTPGVNCPNCGSCTGVRNVSAFAIGGNATIAKPSRVTSNSGINCDAYACPYTGLAGPMGYEAHCESYIASSANWDLAQSMVSTYGTDPGWSEMKDLWYASLQPIGAAYRVTSGGQCNAAAAVDGCAATNWYTVYLAADDDDGNLANGTPNACRIWDAFSAHGIACGARPPCSGESSPPVLCDNPSAAIPDNSTTGVTGTISASGGTISDLNVFVKATHTWVGDLVFTVTSPLGTSAVIIDRPGVPASSFGCDGDNVNALLDDSASSPVETACNSTPPALVGSLKPNNPLSVFNGQPLTGTWTLRVADVASGDTGTLTSWCIATATPTGTPTRSSGDPPSGTRREAPRRAGSPSAR